MELEFTCVHEIKFCDDGQGSPAFWIDLSRNFDRLGGRDVGVRGGHGLVKIKIVKKLFL